MKKQETTEIQNDLLVSSQEYFSDLVREGFEQRKIRVFPQVEAYIVNLLQHYLDAKNLFEPEYDEAGRKLPQTLAEMYLLAGTAEDPYVRLELLKKLGDRSLYVSGFFAESLQRKSVDLEYYVNMGGVAYATLASVVREDGAARVYSAISHNFIDFVDVLTYISHQSFVKTNESILRLYDRYLTTGSELAREKLLEIGVLPSSTDQNKASRS